MKRYNLTFKLSVLFLVIAFVTLAIVAVSADRSVQNEFDRYLQDNRARSGMSRTMVPLLGRAELVFLGSFRDSLLLSVLVCSLIALGLGILLGTIFIRPIRKITSAARKLSEGDLGQRVHISTRDELQDLASAFNQMAENLDMKEKSRRQLLADIAHELRNPITVIQGNLEAWLDGVTSPTPTNIASVHNETLHLGRMVTDLRDLSLAEAHQLRLNTEFANIKDVIEAEISALTISADENRIELRVVADSNLPKIQIDIQRIRQVLRNLITNALRYTPSGGSITVSAETMADTGRTVADSIIVSVTDTGSGISAQDLPYIFTHFYKADPSRHRDGGGSGLGLAIVKQLIESHGGTVSVKSEIGMGSTFSFTIPLPRSVLQTGS
jgi:signal transduction histidine kinase